MVRAVKPEVFEAIVASIPVKRLGEPSEIASIVSWIAGDEAAFATGADFYVDGWLTWDSEDRFFKRQKNGAGRDRASPDRTIGVRVVMALQSDCAQSFAAVGYEHKRCAALRVLPH